MKICKNEFTRYSSLYRSHYVYSNDIFLILLKFENILFFISRQNRSIVMIFSSKPLNMYSNCHNSVRIGSKRMSVHCLTGNMTGLLSCNFQYVYTNRLLWRRNFEIVASSQMMSHFSFLPVKKSCQSWGVLSVCLFSQISQSLLNKVKTKSTHASVVREIIIVQCMFI